MVLLAACTTESVEQAAAPDPDRVEVWTTTSDLQQALSPSTLTMTASGDAADIEIDAQTRHQRMLGFGASITDASAWLIQHRMSETQRDALLRHLFGREGDGVGFDFARLTIGASDFSRHHYSLDDPPDGKPDPGLEHFSIDVNRDDVIPVTQQALAINPQLKIMASPWSAPAWMKDSGSLVTGQLLPEHYDAFARYLLAYVDAYAGEGIPVFALTVQNEPDYEPKDYPGMRFNAPARARFIGDHLGPLREQRHPQLQIFDWDHNWDKPEEPMAVLADPAASKHVSAVAWHCYGGSVDAQTPVRDAYPDKDVYLTECSGGDWEPVISGGLTLQARNLVIGTTRNWARGVLFWNLALDENNGPNTGGCYTCRGLVTIDSKTGEVTRTVDYYALAHASRFVRRDAWRIGSTEAGEGIDNVAFENADDGSRVLMVSNSSDEPRTITVGEGGRRFEHELPAKSVVTFRWLARGE
ncbi:MAG TPA: glycoside hydrolase family 30 beta sandwich domain-containing protein [Luteimonas sp.]|nr:glycoside hydrolase family 30 beta sandwich domain-containing protein [Luteimonas sp.]HRO26743.1 glycoside hydrolase family 30 beta sandwich domain-containing protein [Luteimonas sp.]HRP72322.1 glycoside hydrolase family 30 beta sandwich domain-containing protein [Luteimonas sp.]